MVYLNHTDVMGTETARGHISFPHGILIYRIRGRDFLFAVLTVISPQHVGLHAQPADTSLVEKIMYVQPFILFFTISSIYSSP